MQYNDGIDENKHVRSLTKQLCSDEIAYCSISDEIAEHNHVAMSSPAKQIGSDDIANCSSNDEIVEHNNVASETKR